MAIKIMVGMVYRPKGALGKNQVITSIQEDGSNFIKAAVYSDMGITYVYAFGGGDITEIGKVVGSMTQEEIIEGQRNFLERVRNAKENE